LWFIITRRRPTFDAKTKEKKTGLYIGSTTGYASKNMITLALGMKFQKDGLNAGYMKPVGAVPGKIDGKIGNEDAFFIQNIYGA
jgi:hypothetical protein